MKTAERTRAAAGVRATYGWRAAVERIPWLWTNFVNSHPRVPTWVFSFALFGVLYASTGLFSALAGGARRGLTDPQFFAVPTLLPALGGLALVYIPRQADRLTAALRSWHAAGDLEPPSVRRLLRFFWGGALLIGALILPWTVIGPETNAALQGFAHPWVIRAYIPLFAGIRLLRRRGIEHRSPGTTGLYFGSATVYGARGQVSGKWGKGSPSSAHRMLFAIWGLVAFPMLALTLASLAANAPSLESDRIAWTTQVASTVFIAVLLILPVVIPHLLINRWLAGQKESELRQLRRELQEIAAVPEDAPPGEASKRTLRHLHTTSQIQYVQTIPPTLMNIGSLLQIGGSIGAAVLANIVLPFLVSALSK